MERMQDMARNYAGAWSSHSPEAVAGYYVPDGRITINRGEPVIGRDAIKATATAFFTAYPDLVVHCDSFRQSGSHALFAWTLEGHHAETGAFVRVSGWEEWELDGEGKVSSSLGWFDAGDEARQIGRAG